MRNDKVTPPMTGGNIIDLPQVYAILNGKLGKQVHIQISMKTSSSTVLLILENNKQMFTNRALPGKYQPTG